MSWEERPLARARLRFVRATTPFQIEVPGIQEPTQCVGRHAFGARVQPLIRPLRALGQDTTFGAHGAAGDMTERYSDNDTSPSAGPTHELLHGGSGL